MAIKILSEHHVTSESGERRALRFALLSANVPYLKYALVDKGLFVRAPASVPNTRSRRRKVYIPAVAASQHLIVNAFSQSRERERERFPTRPFVLVDQDDECRLS